MKFPALAIAFSFAAGIAAGEFLTHRVTHILTFCFLAVPFLLLLALLLLLPRHNTSAGGASLLAWAFLGVAAVQIAPLAVPANHITRQIDARVIDLKQPLRWRGTLRSDPLRLPWGMRYEVDLDAVQTAGIWRSVSGGLRIGYFFSERDERNAQQAAAATADLADAVGPDASTGDVASTDPPIPSRCVAWLLERAIVWKLFCAPVPRAILATPALSITRSFLPASKSMSPDSCAAPRSLHALRLLRPR